MTLERGYLLNKRYRIVEILGQGGMAAVYRAVDENLGVEVALKENLFTTEEYARQFRREAVIMANLRHPNLPRVTDHFVIEQQGQYLVMDYIEGEDLRQRMDRIGALPEQEVVILGAAMCDALTYLHTRKPMVLHRDLKPGNVKITPQGTIFLVDFGLAKVMQGRQATTTGARAMTPGYSPPEQYGTARTDHRSDIYSLGATLYSALTDAIPEDGLARAMEQTTLTPLTKRNPKISRKLANCIEKSLEVRPDDRWQSAEDFKTELLNTRSTTRRKLPLDLVLEPPPQLNGDNISVPEIPKAEEKPDKREEKPVEAGKMSFPISTPLVDIPTPVQIRRRRKFNRKWLWLIPILILISGAIALGINPNIPLQALAWLRPSNTPTERIVTQTLPVVVLPSATQTASPSTTPSPSPTASPTLAPSPTITPSPEPSPTSTLAPSPTPIGGGVGQLAFVSDRSGIPEIYLMDTSGNILKQITDISAGACQPAWSPDGTRLLFTSPCLKNRDLYPGSSLFLINADGSGLVPFLPNVPGGDFSPTWSPDGKFVAFVSLRNDNTPQIYVANVENNTINSLGDDPPRSNTDPGWSPSGRQIVYTFGDNQIRVMDSNGSNRFLLARNTSTFITGNPTWSPQGLAVIFTEWSPDKVTSWLMAVSYSSEGGLPVRINGTDYGYEPEFSPDGFWVAFTAYPSGNRDIYIITPSGVGRVQLTSDPANDFDPAWRPTINLP